MGMGSADDRYGYTSTRGGRITKEKKVVMPRHGNPRDCVQCFLSAPTTVHPSGSDLHPPPPPLTFCPLSVFFLLNVSSLSKFSPTSKPYHHRASAYIMYLSLKSASVAINSHVWNFVPNVSKKSTKVQHKRMWFYSINKIVWFAGEKKWIKTKSEPIALLI